MVHTAPLVVRGVSETRGPNCLVNRQRLLNILTQQKPSFLRPNNIRRRRVRAEIETDYTSRILIIVARNPVWRKDGCRLSL